MSCEIEFSLPLLHGLHARPASALQEAASVFQSDVRFINRRNNREANAKSVLSLVGTDARHEDPCALMIAGEDAETACPALRAFVEDTLPGVDEELPAPEALAEEGALAPRVLAQEEAAYWTGTPVSAGAGRGPARVVGGLSLPDAARSAEGPGEEQARFATALTDVAVRLEGQRNRAANATERAIVEAHLAIAQDPEFLAFVRERLAEGGLSAGAAVLEAEAHYGDVLRASESAYMRERAMDVRDISGQILRAMYGGDDRITLAEPTVVVAESLLPSQLLSLDCALLRGLALTEGGTTSHTAILARAFGIPCVSGVADIHRTVSEGQDVIVDGSRGLVVPEPSEPVARYYALEAQRDETRRARLAAGAHEEARTKDGRRVEVAANVSTPEEAEAAFSAGADGIGLFRTEMLFMDRDAAPDEEEQHEAYARAVRAAEGRTVIIRTLDIGGDKPLAYLNLPAEENPFLGYRAIRFYRDFPDLVRVQLRAILRAAALGTVWVMFPMVATVEEARAAREMLDAARESLEADGVAHGPVELGVMIEVPSAALTVDLLAQEVSFFSIGTNDLTQYTLAVDRGNKRVAPLYSSLHPAFLRLLRQIADTAHASGRWVGLCGEMGGQESLVPLLAGLGLEEVSVSSPAIPAIKHAVRRVDAAACRTLLDDAASRPDRAAVEAALADFAAASASVPVLGAEITDLNSEAASRTEVIKEMVDSLYLAGRVSNPNTVEEAVWLREDVYSTGVGFGFAIPHCKSPDVVANSVAIRRLKTPVAWNSLDGEPVRIALMLAIRESDHAEEHLRIFARLARKIMHEDFRERLLAEESVEDLLAFVADAIEG